MVKRMVRLGLVTLLLCSLLSALSLSAIAADADVVLTLATTWTGGPEAKGPEDSVYYQEIIKATGIQIKFVPGNDEQLALLYAADDLPDIIATSDINTMMGSGVYKLIADEMILPLNSLFDAGYAPNLKGWFDSNEEMDRLAKTDEGLYFGFPMLRTPDSYLTFGGMMIRQDWLDELGLSMPTTMEEWDEVLRAFKDEKGATSALSGMWAQLDPIRNAYGVMDGFFAEDGVVKFGPLEESYEAYLTQLNTWMMDGILDPDIYTESADAVYAKIADGQIGAISGYTGSTFNKIVTMLPDHPEMNFVAAPNPIVDPEKGYPFVTADYLMSRFASVITTNCEHPELAATFLDYVYSPEGVILANHGVEGISFEYDADGEIVYTELITNNPNGYSLVDARSIYAGEQNKAQVVTRDGQAGMYPLDVQKDSIDIWEEKDKPCRALPFLSFTADEIEANNNIMSDINTYVAENRLMFILGTQSMDNYAQFVANLRAMGIEEALAIQQVAYDRYLSR